MVAAFGAMAIKIRKFSFFAIAYYLEDSTTLMLCQQLLKTFFHRLVNTLIKAKSIP
jgi:hypothetical protein